MKNLVWKNRPWSSTSRSAPSSGVGAELATVPRNPAACGRVALCALLLSAIGLGQFQARAAAGTTLLFQNLGMEEGESTPAAWVKGPAVAGVEQTWDRTIAHGGKASLCLKKTAQRYFPIAQWHQSVTVAPANTARKVRVRCWVKAQDVTKAIIDVTYQAQQAGHQWAVYLGQKQPSDPVATHDWKLFEATVQVPAQASKVGIALQIYGPGTVWFDDLEVAWAD